MEAVNQRDGLLDIPTENGSWINVSRSTLLLERRLMDGNVESNYSSVFHYSFQINLDFVTKIPLSKFCSYGLLVKIF